MTPGAYNLTIYRGDTYNWTFALWQDADKTQPVDLTGVTALAEIRNRPGGATVVPMTCTVGADNSIAMALGAAASASLPLGSASASGGFGAAATNTLPDWLGAWDLQLTFENGQVATILAGTVTVTGDVTQSTAAAAAAAALKVVA